MQLKLVGETKVAQSEEVSLVWSLTQGRIYTVLGIEADYFRLLNDDLRLPGEEPSRRSRPDLRSDEEKRTRPYPDRFAPAPALFSPKLFEIVDDTEPDFWVCELGEGGERYCYPEEWMPAGFFEDYFDCLPEAHALFWDVYYRLYANA